MPAIASTPPAWVSSGELDGGVGVGKNEISPGPQAAQLMASGWGWDYEPGMFVISPDSPVIICADVIGGAGFFEYWKEHNYHSGGHFVRFVRWIGKRPCWADLPQLAGVPVAVGYAAKYMGDKRCAERFGATSLNYGWPPVIGLANGIWLQGAVDAGVALPKELMKARWVRYDGREFSEAGKKEGNKLGSFSVSGLIKRGPLLGDVS